jgi:hypothetical protein
MTSRNLTTNNVYFIVIVDKGIFSPIHVILSVLQSHYYDLSHALKINYIWKNQIVY